MKKKVIASVPYLLALSIDFYLLPCLIQDTGTAMLLVMAVMPLAAFVTAVIYGIRRGISLLLPLAAGLLFFPSLFLFYNLSAWVYCPVYAVIVLAGNILGRVFYGRR